MLDSLHIKNFRCFEDLTIPSLGRVNLIVGKNNSGKSTLLEAIYLYTHAGNPATIRELLEKRGDSDISINIDYNAIFYQNTPPSSFEERLEISDEKQKKYVIITDYSDESEEKIHQLTDSLLSYDVVFSMGSNYYSNLENLKKILRDDDKTPPMPFKISNIENGRLIDARPVLNVFYSPAYIEKSSILADMWDQVFLNDDDSIIKSALQIIDENIVNLSFIPAKNIDNKPNKESRIAVVKIRKQPKAIPIKSLGDGASRLLQIFLYAMQAKNGYLLIDEIENGLHYSIQEEVWKKLFKLAKELDIQVFATTHSEDTVKAFAKVTVADREIEGKLISLGRSAAIADNGKILADVYDEKTLEILVQSGMEVR